MKYSKKGGFYEGLPLVARTLYFRLVVLEPVRTIELFQKPPSPKTFSTGEVIFQAGERSDVIYGII